MTTPRQAAAEMRTAAAETARRFEPDERSDIDYASDLIRALPLPIETTEPEDETDKPPLGDASYARQWASDTLSGRVGGGKFPWGERNLSHAFLNMLGTTNTMEISSAAYLSAAYDWRKKAERMKAALEKATETLIAVEAALMLIDTLCQDRGRSTKQARCGEVARDTLTTICEALGET